MTLNQLPSTFCWTKMGVESGEDLSSIIRRKEWERRLGSGLFLWGIGQSLGANAELAAAEAPSLSAVFSPMLSKPKSIDTEPGEVVLWNSWVDGSGQARTLPLHTFVTSRAFLPSGRRKDSHYALVCTSSAQLAATGCQLTVPSGALRNIVTGKALGASQVTAVVSFSPDQLHTTGKSYPVSFVVQLEAPFFVRLANPVSLRGRDVKLAAEIACNGEMADWAKFISRLRAAPAAEKERGRTLEMFEPEQPLLEATTCPRMLSYA
ncbi:hypothetical protein [Paraburkholderia kururiensis]|uniref:hypothetical protein n=1 Tax=Paraburkholderia kururiensis TaxID=984307 RepID=UPI0018F41E04|nr:hypothetical protein [Paraburkholderia kururiensis]